MFKVTGWGNASVPENEVIKMFPFTDNPKIYFDEALHPGEKGVAKIQQINIEPEDQIEIKLD